MRCALRYEEDLLFAEQKVEAWGEYQSLKEEPDYKETEILNYRAKEYFCYYKDAMDDAVGMLEAITDDEELIADFKDSCAGNICELLFALIDEQEEEV